MGDQGVAPLTLSIVESLSPILDLHPQPTKNQNNNGSSNSHCNVEIPTTAPPFRLHPHVRASLFEVCQLSLRLIRQCVFRNARCASEFSLYIPRLERFSDSKNWGVKDTLVELYRDHPQLVDTPDDASTVLHTIDRVRKEGRAG